MTDFDKWQIAEARCADLQARCERLLGALMLVTFPRNGDYGGPLVTVTARYEDGSEIGRGHSENREASAALQHTTAETGECIHNWVYGGSFRRCSKCNRAERNTPQEKAAPAGKG